MTACFKPGGGYMRHFLATIIITALAGTASAAELVRPAEIGEGLFDGRAIVSTDRRGRSAELVFQPGGEVVLTPASGEKRAGTWRLSDEGFCLSLGGRGGESCYLLVRGDTGALRAVPLGDAFIWKAGATDQAAVEPVSGLAGSQE